MPNTPKRRRRSRADLPPERQQLYDRWLAAVHLNGADGMREGRKLLADYGAPAELAEELIYRGRELRRRELRDLAGATGLPEEWFVAPDWRLLIRFPARRGFIDEGVLTFDEALRRPRDRRDDDESDAPGKPPRS